MSFAFCFIQSDLDEFLGLCSALCVLYEYFEGHYMCP